MRSAPVHLPAPSRSVISSLPWDYSLAVPARLPERRRHRLPLAELHPCIHIAHRRLGDVGLIYRMIPDHEFIAVLQGQGDLHLGTERHRIAAPCLLLLPPFVPHAVLTGGHPIGDHLAIHCDLAPGVPDRPRVGHPRRPYAVDLAVAEPLPPVLPLDDRCISLISDAIHLHHARDETSALLASCRLQELILHLLERRRERSARVAGDAAVGAALALIAARYDERLTVADLAAAAGMRRSRFADRFRAWSGRSPMAFLRRYRIDRACELLREPVGLEHIAAACGYADGFALSKAFRAELGMSPSAFRTRIGVSNMPAAP